MPKCSCGNTVEKLPLWLDRVDVAFRCSKCPSAAVVPPVLPTAYAKDEEDLEQDLLGEDVDDDAEELDEDASDEPGD